MTHVGTGRTAWRTGRCFRCGLWRPGGRDCPGSWLAGSGSRGRRRWKKTNRVHSLPPRRQSCVGGFNQSWWQSTHPHGFPKWLNKLHSHREFYLQWGVAYGNNLTELIRWRKWNNQKWLRRRRESDTGKIGKGRTHQIDRFPVIRMCIDLCRTLGKKCIGCWCGALSPLDICPRACITSTKKHTMTYWISDNQIQKLVWS